MFQLSYGRLYPQQCADEPHDEAGLLCVYGTRHRSIPPTCMLSGLDKTATSWSWIRLWPDPEVVDSRHHQRPMDLFLNASVQLELRVVSGVVHLMTSPFSRQLERMQLERTSKGHLVVEERSLFHQKQRLLGCRTL